MLKSHCINSIETKFKKKKKKKDAFLGCEALSLGLIGHRRNHYATETDGKFPVKYLHI